MYNHNVPSLVASLFSWRCLAASTSPFLHAAINLRPRFVTVSIQRRRFPVPRKAKRPDVYAVGTAQRLDRTDRPLHKSDDNEQDWQPYPVDPYSDDARSNGHTCLSVATGGHAVFPALDMVFNTTYS